MALADNPKPPIFPPLWFVERYNEAGFSDRYRTALDPLVVLAWHMATESVHCCPECGATTGTVLCDGCKFETCRSCGYPCACGGDDE